MNLRSHFAVLKQLTRETFLQAWASGIGWMMLAGTAVCVLFCLSVSISGDVKLTAEGEPGLFLPRPPPATFVPSVVLVLGSSGPLDALTRMAVAREKVWKDYDPDLAMGVTTEAGQLALAFGAVPIPLFRERGDAVRFLELFLSEIVAGILGLLLALVWTAGFAPAFLEPSAASVLLAKPVARWQLLLGKFVAVLIFLTFQLVLFVVLTWLALGVRTNVWDLTYWRCIPLLLLQFAVFYSFSVLVAVATRSTAACVVGVVLFWLLAWGINYGSVMAARSPDLPAITQTLIRAAYWISPKPIDGGVILFNALDKQQHVAKFTIFQLLESSPGFSPELSTLSCLAILGVLLAMSAYEFHATDY